MRRIVLSLGLALESVSVHAHDECMNHHWLSHDYRSELGYQLELMLVVIAAIAAGEIIAQLRRSKQ